MATEAAAGADRASALTGYVDGVFNGQVIGWCCHADDPATRLTVEAFVDGIAIGAATAELPRDSVARAGFGDGRYGFEIPLPARLADGGEHRIAVRLGQTTLPPTPAFAAGEHRDRAGAVWESTTFAPEPAQEAGAATADGDRTPAAPTVGSSEPVVVHLAGYVDGVVDATIRGWVADPGVPDSSIAVEAFLDGLRVGASAADDRRPDVARQGLGERHGFRIPLPEPLTPGRHELEVRTAAEGRRVPLAREYVVLGPERTPVQDVELHEPPEGTRADAARPSHALLGTDGWLFPWSSARAFDALRGARAMPRAALERQLDRILERSDLVRAGGGTLIEAVVPAKLAVYDRQLPPGVALEDRGRPADELAAALRDDNGVELLDLTLALRQAIGHGPLFTRTGVRLTWLGGFYAYRCVAKELAKTLDGLRPLPPAALSLRAEELEPVPDSLADLPRLVSLGDEMALVGTAARDEPREGRPVLDWRRLEADYVVPAPELAAMAGPEASLLRRRAADQGRTALLIHDGSAEPMLPFLAGHFDELLIVGGDADVRALMRLLSPAAVLEVIAEASLLS
jgi:SGNH hydrolase-like domain, acetyltransferase AlgX